MVCGGLEGFVVSGVSGVNSSPLIFVGCEGVTRSVGILNLGCGLSLPLGLTSGKRSCCSGPPSCVKGIWYY